MVTCRRVCRLVGAVAVNSRIARMPDERRGVTTVEVLVVIGILGLLASLIIPAVQRSRATARLTQCRSRLQQIMLAVHDHEAAEGGFPGLGFHEKLRPYLGVDLSANESVVYVCPEDPESIGNWGSGRQSYLMNAGVDEEFEAGFSPAPGRPVQSAAQIRDGLSNTAAIAERLAFPRISGGLVNWDDYPQWWNRRLRDTAVYHADLDAFANECEHRALAPLSVWHHARRYNHVLPPNRNSCINESLQRREYAFTASSLHVHGINVGLGDGAVRFISDDIDRPLWRAMGTRAGREVMTNF